VKRAMKLVGLDRGGGQIVDAVVRSMMSGVGPKARSF